MRSLAMLCVFAAACGGTLPESASGSDEDTAGGAYALTSTPKRVQHIPYKGGEILHHPREYNLYWGSYYKTAAGKHEVDVLDAFAQHVGGSDWFAITQEYPDQSGPVANASVKGGSAVIAKDPTPTLTDLDIRNFVIAQIEGGTIPWDPAGIYFVFTPPKVVIHGGIRGGGTSCQSVCGYHHFWHTTLRGQGEQDVLYSNIPHGDCPDGCSIKGVNVNGAALDQETVTLSHELAETATDPVLTAWTTGKGENELGDLCNSGSQQTWGGQSFAVQDLWSNKGRHCAHAE